MPEEITPASTRYTRKSDGTIVTAMQATNDDITSVPGVFIDPKTDADPNPAPYVITKTGMHEPVYQNDYVVTENDGEHYYTYPADKFHAEYELVTPTVPASTPAVNPSAAGTATAGVTAPNAITDTAVNPAVLSAAAGTNPGTHSPSSPDAPSADEAASALSTIMEHLPKLHAAVVEGAKIAASASYFTAEQKSKLLSAAAVVEKRFKML